MEDLHDAVIPFVAMDEKISGKDEPARYAFDSWADGAIVFNIGKKKCITAGDLRKIRIAGEDR